MRDEFNAWAREVKRVEPPGAKGELEALFADFCEDFNTCTLPGEKYYDLRAWEAAERAGAAGAGAGAARLSDADARRAEAAAAARARTAEQLDLLRRSALAPARVAEVRERQELIARQKYAFDRGDVRETALIRDKLAALDKAAAEARFK
jgi:hypothetical protein